MISSSGPVGRMRGASRSATNRLTHNTAKNSRVKMNASSIDAPEAERVEPEEIGVEAGDPPQRRGHDDQHHDRQDQGHPPSPDVPRATGQVAGSAHGGDAS